jgi:hypothetical protein
MYSINGREEYYFVQLIKIFVVMLIYIHVFKHAANKTGMDTFTFLNVRRPQNYPPIDEIQDLAGQKLICEQPLS